MPLTKTGKKVLAKMKSRYGGEKGKQVFYAKMNKEDGYTDKWHKKRGGKK